MPPAGAAAIRAMSTSIICELAKDPQRNKAFTAAANKWPLAQNAAHFSGLLGHQKTCCETYRKRASLETVGFYQRMSQELRDLFVALSPEAPVCNARLAQLDLSLDLDSDDDDDDEGYDYRLAQGEPGRHHGCCSTNFSR